MKSDFENPKYKVALKTIGYGMLQAVVIVGVIVGFIWGFALLLDASHKDSVKRCNENVAQIGGYKAEYKGGYCLFVRDGKIEEAK